MVRVGQISIDLIANTGQLLKPLRAAQRQVETFGGAIKSSLGGALSGIHRMLGSTTAKLTMLTGGLGIGGLATYAVKQAMAYEDASTAFATFLRSGDKAKALLADLQKFSDVTPFTAEQVQTAGRGLLAFGFAADSIIPTLQYLGDAAAGSQQDINELVNILGKVKSKGKLQLEELNRFTERGIVLIPNLAKQMQVSEKEVYKFISAGKLGFPEVEMALKSLNTAGGLFEGAMANLSRTVSGKLSTLKSEFNNTMRDIGTAIVEGIALRGILDSGIAALSKYRAAFVKVVEDVVQRVVGRLQPAMQYVSDLLSEAGTSGEFTFGEQIADAVTFCIDRVSDLGSAVQWLAGQWKYAEIGLAAFSAMLDEAVMQADANIKELMNFVVWNSEQGEWGKKFRQFLGIDTLVDKAGINKPNVLSPYDKFGAGAAQENLKKFIAESERLLTSMMHDLDKKTPSFIRALRKNTEKDANKLRDLTTKLGADMEPLSDLGGVGKQESIGAFERGSAAAYSAIAETMRRNTEEQQLVELRKIKDGVDALGDDAIFVRRAALT